MHERCDAHEDNPSGRPTCRLAVCSMLAQIPSSCIGAVGCGDCSEVSNTAGCMLAAACTAHAAAAIDTTAAILLEKMSRLALACAASTFAGTGRKRR